MGKIPKRKGQAINGKGVSVIAAAALIFLLPIVLAYMVDFAILFGDEEEDNAAFYSVDFVGYNSTVPVFESDPDTNAFFEGKYMSYDGQAPFYLNAGNAGATKCNEFNYPFSIPSESQIEDHLEPVDYAMITLAGGYTTNGAYEPQMSNYTVPLGCSTALRNSNGNLTGQSTYLLGTQNAGAIINYTNAGGSTAYCGVGLPITLGSQSCANPYEGPYPLVTYDYSRYWAHLPNCNYYDIASSKSQFFDSYCGDSNIDIVYPWDQLFPDPDKASSVFRFEFLSQTGSTVCTSDIFDDSLVDYTLNFTAFSKYSDSGSFNLFNDFSDYNFEVKGTSSFFNGFVTETVNLVEYCKPYLKIEIELNYAQLMQLTELQKQTDRPDPINGEFWNPNHWKFVRLEIDNIRSEDGNSFRSDGLVHPFNQEGGYNETNNDILTSVLSNQFVVEPTNFVLRIEMLILGIVLLAGAFASTPAWDPLKGWLKR